MKRKYAWRALALAALLNACQSMSPRTVTDLQLLQGYWEGKGPGGECAVTISGNRLSYSQPSRDATRPEFWFETTLKLVADTDPKQFHATIVDNVHQDHIGTVVVTIFKLEGEKLTLGVVKDFEEPPTEPVTGDWEWAFDQYYLERAEPRKGKTHHLPIHRPESP